MKPVIWLPTSCALLLILAGCSNQAPDVGPGTGPFDSAGNYRDDWADDPSKWRKPGSRTRLPADDVPYIAKNEQPPANANPLGPQVVSNPKPTVAKPTVAKPTVAKPTVATVESTPRETVKTTAAPKTVVAKPKPKPTVVKAKPKPKPKPKSTRYIVKKGDSLSAIAARNGSSVSAIQKANGISGTLIRPGQSLVVPKR